MRHSLLVLLLLLLFSCEKENELNDEIEVKNADARLNNYWDLYEAHKVSSQDSALYYMQEIKILAETTNKTQWLAAAYGAIADIHLKKGNLGESTFYYLNAIRLQKELGELKKLAVLYTNLGFVYESIEEYEEAILYSLQAKDIFFYEGNSYEKANTYRNLALYHSYLMKFDEAEEYIHQAEKIALKAQDYNMLSKIYNTTGVVNFKQQQYDKAREHYLKAIQYSDSTDKGQWTKTAAIGNIGETYFKEKDYLQAEEWLSKALVMTEEINDPVLSQINLNLFAEMLMEQGKQRIAADLLLDNFTRSDLTKTSSATDEGLTLALDALTKLANEKEPEKATELARDFGLLNAYSKTYTTQTRQLREELHTLSQQLAVQANVSRYTQYEEAQEAARKNLQVILFSTFLLICALVALVLVMRKNMRYKKLYAKVEDILNSQALRHMKKG